MELPQLHVDALVLEDTLRPDELELHGALAQQPVLVEHVAGLEQRQVLLVELVLERRLRDARVAQAHGLQEAELDHAVRV